MSGSPAESPERINLLIPNATSTNNVRPAPVAPDLIKMAMSAKSVARMKLEN